MTSTTFAAPTAGRAESSSHPVLRRCGGVQCPPGTCDHDGQLRRSPTGSGPASAPPIVDRVLASPGQPLDAGARSFLEPRFGHDFSRVRIHTDADAATSAASVGAHAYTVGDHVAFAAGAYQPATAEGRKLIAHELTHVVQQSGTSAAPAASLAVGAVDDPAEEEAEDVADTVFAGGPPVAVAPRLAKSVQRHRNHPGCSQANIDLIHQAIFDARGWLDKAVPALEVTPLAARTLRSLRRNFGPTYGVEVNADLIRGRLVAARTAIGTIPISCAANAADATCAGGPCGYAVAGSNEATVCEDNTLAAGGSWLFRAGCVLHETFHARFSRMGVDSYSGWHGASTSTAAYPGAGVDPLLNADSYTTLVMDLS